MLYEHVFGVIPRIHKGKIENGGIPQQADLNAHLAKVRRDVAQAIPDPNWSGYAIIDLEAWDPLWEGTAKEYHEASIRLARQSHPGRSENDIRRLAKASYEEAARTFLERTLRECRSLRPRAKWGYYAWPWPHHEPAAARLKWLWDGSTALFPNCYMVYKSAAGGKHTEGLAPPEEYEQEARKKVELARRLAGPNKPVIALIWPRYHDINAVFGKQLATREDLERMLRVPREAGADGVAFWESFDTEESAREYAGYFREVLVPALRGGAGQSTLRTR